MDLIGNLNEGVFRADGRFSFRGYGLGWSSISAHRTQRPRDTSSLLRSALHALQRHPRAEVTRVVDRLCTCASASGALARVRFPAPWPGLAWPGPATPARGRFPWPLAWPGLARPPPPGPPGPRGLQKFVG